MIKYRKEVPTLVWARLKRLVTILYVSKEKKLDELLKVEKNHIVNLKKELDAEELNEQKLQLELIKEEMEHKRELNKLLKQVSSLKVKEKFL
ncbi:unnamed protein product [Arctia plantaginis]|uniref:Uncharacterized protein n=1 Tax=Arctia plantaginis TaxID=874455 RepID=A0A8S1B7L9_ARCPL|nr:unnamed protein product [Arctia plantaginis]CAB3258709.1 unnamed protein product [Arctia plantaginis]